MTAKIEPIVRRKIRINSVLYLTAENIRELLAAAGHDVPSSAEVKFRVPSGRDYSGENVGISNEHPIRVSWEATEES